VVHEGDLDKAHYLLGQIPGPEGERVRAICGPTVETGPLATARERFLTAFLVAYPGAPAGPKVWTAMLCGAAALLPFFVGAAGRASVPAAAMELGAAIPDQALGLYQLGAIETAAAGAVAWAILLGVHHLDPGARTVRRRLVERQRALRKERPPAPATAAAGRSAHRVP